MPSSTKNSQVRKNSRVMKKYFEDLKGSKSSRNAESRKRLKNSTQLVGMVSSSRNASSNAALSNLSATNRLRKSFKSSLGN